MFKDLTFKQMGMLALIFWVTKRAVLFLGAKYAHIGGVVGVVLQYVVADPMITAGVITFLTTKQGQAFALKIKDKLAPVSPVKHKDQLETLESEVPALKESIAALSARVDEVTRAVRALQTKPTAP